MFGRLILSFVAAGLVIGAPNLARAQFKPAKQVEFVVHGGPGSGNDVFARALTTIIEQEKLSPVRFQVSNRPGGNSSTAASYVVSKKGDPHVIACFTNLWVVNPLLAKAATAQLSDMTPIIRLVVEPALVVVRADSQIKSMADFIKLAKAQPGKLKWSGGSVTSREAVVRQLLMKVTGTSWAFISFPSGGERLAALLGGHVDMMIVDPSEAGEQIRAGKMRAIAQVSERRLPGFPDIPTIKEAGYDIPDVPQMRGVAGSPDMPADAVAWYEGVFTKAANTPAWQKFLRDSELDGEIVRGNELKAFLAKFEIQLRDILKEAGAKVVR